MLRPLAALAALLAATALPPAHAQSAPPAWTAALPAPLPPVLPWKGASERLIVPAGHPWITEAEASGFTRTSTYAQTMEWLRRLDAASPRIRLEVFGRTPEGRDMVAVIAGREDASRPVVLVQGGIHSGEVDGKDGGLMLLRDLAVGGKGALLDRVTLLFVPIYNVDGHERAGPYNRANQRGPENAGWRTTSQNHNLNREYLKLDAPEARAMIGLIRKYDPAIYFDLHTTNGQDQQNDITIQYDGWFGRPARSPASGRWMDESLAPALFRALEAAGHTPGYYVDLIDTRRPAAGVEILPGTARFSTGYGDLRRLPTVLVESHSLKPNRQRVLAQYVLVEAALRRVGEDGAALRAAVAADRARRPASVPLNYARAKTPEGTYRWRGIAQDTYFSPASGRAEQRWLGRRLDETVPRYFEQLTGSIAMPRAWWVPASAPDIIERLRLHGVAMEVAEAPRTVEVEMARLVDPKIGAPSEGRVPVTIAGTTRESRRVTFPAGSVRVPADQMLGELAAMWLEPQSGEGALAWGFLPHILQRTEYMDPYALAPLADAMLARDPTLRAEFEAALKADPKFAADGNARLLWFYRRTPYLDDRFQLWPVGRELD